MEVSSLRKYEKQIKIRISAFRDIVVICPNSVQRKYEPLVFIGSILPLYGQRKLYFVFARWRVSPMLANKVACCIGYVGIIIAHDLITADFPN